jgi:hypothetical protein
MSLTFKLNFNSDLSVSTKLDFPTLCHPVNGPELEPFALCLHSCLLELCSRSHQSARPDPPMKLPSSLGFLWNRLISSVDAPARPCMQHNKNRSQIVNFNWEDCRIDYIGVRVPQKATASRPKKRLARGIYCGVSWPQFAFFVCLGPQHKLNAVQKL